MIRPAPGCDARGPAPEGETGPADQACASVRAGFGSWLPHDDAAADARAKQARAKAQRDKKKKRKQKAKGRKRK